MIYTNELLKILLYEIKKVALKVKTTKEKKNPLFKYVLEKTGLRYKVSIIVKTGLRSKVSIIVKTGLRL
jgi:hypothetical protein